MIIETIFWSALMLLGFILGVNTMYYTIRWNSISAKKLRIRWDAQRERERKLAEAKLEELKQRIG